MESVSHNPIPEVMDSLPLLCRLSSVPPPPPPAMSPNPPSPKEGEVVPEAESDGLPSPEKVISDKGEIGPSLPPSTFSPIEIDTVALAFLFLPFPVDPEVRSEEVREGLNEPASEEEILRLLGGLRLGLMREVVVLDV